MMISVTLMMTVMVMVILYRAIYYAIIFYPDSGRTGESNEYFHRLQVFLNQGGPVVRQVLHLVPALSTVFCIPSFIHDVACCHGNFIDRPC